MSNKELDTAVATAPATPADAPMAYIVAQEDGYHVQELDGTMGPACKLVDEGDRTIALTRNASNRKWYNRAKADEAIKATGSCPLYYKESRTFGPATAHMPNEKLVAYLSEAEQAEYKAIVDRARAALEADRKKPVTELEKAQARVAKAEAALAKLREQAAAATPTLVAAADSTAAADTLNNKEDN